MCLFAERSHESTCSFSSNEKTACAHNDVFDDKTTSTRKHGEAVATYEIGKTFVSIGVAIGKIRHPAFGGGDEERESDDAHAEGEQSAEHTHAWQPDAEEHESADGANHQTKTDRESICAIFLVPFDVFHDYFTFFVLVEVVFFDFFAVFRVDGSLRRIVVKEAHKGTVAHEGHDAVCFILTHFETANPSHNNEDGNAKISVEMTFETKENARSKFEQGVDSSHSRK